MKPTALIRFITASRLGLGLCLFAAAAGAKPGSESEPNSPPALTAVAGPDRIVVLGAKTYLDGFAGYGQPIKNEKHFQNPAIRALWSKVAGPGEVRFANPQAATTTASFTATGTYVLELTADNNQIQTNATLTVTVEAPAPARHLAQIPTRPYKINSPLWSDRLKAVIVNWIPHCYNKLSEPNLPEGGINNFIEAGKKLAGQPAKHQVGPPWANAYVHNTVESMAYALMVDAQGDADILDAQNAMRAKLEEWIPIILAAQEPDGYLQTRFTLATDGATRWSPRTRGEHEGYTGGYFIEAALAHYQMTGMKDARLYNAALKLADCWDRNLGPTPKQTWYDGHQEMEQALVRLGRFVNATQGHGGGDRYIALARFLLDSRKNGSEYDQSHVPVVRQYQAVGHAVRATYTYSGMTDIALETGDLEYQSAVRSLWDNIVNRKCYVTGGLGSGETSEGFGTDYSLRNNAYCESCANCGELLFQHRLNLLYRDARYADLYEDALYNSILGDLDLDGKNFYYDNPLDSTQPRYPWHGCPCCVGNIPRVLLQLPTWMYAKDPAGLCVNLFVGSTVEVGEVSGTPVRMVQRTDYPWSGKVSLTVNPAAPRRFTVRVRIPNRNVTTLYTATPAYGGLTSLQINGRDVSPKMEGGYAVLERKWQPGDTIELVLPLQVQRVKTSDKVAADLGKVALRYGPLIYNIETVDQDVNQVLPPTAALAAEWRGDLLNGVMVIKGQFADGSNLLAIPNYARNNRMPAKGAQPERPFKSIVWINDR